METWNGVSAVLGDDEGLSGEGFMPVLHVERQLQLDHLRVPRVRVPAIVTVETYHIHKLDLQQIQSRLAKVYGSKHVKGSQERYLFGQNTICEFSG